MSRTHPKNKQSELEHHLTYDESLDSQICKLHITVLGTGRIPKRFLNAFHKANEGLALTPEENKQVELLHEYLERFDLPKSKLDGSLFVWFTHWQKRHLLAFTQFIDDPIRCHQGRFLALHHCKSTLKSLQHKQRVTLVKVVTTLFTRLNVESLRIGEYPSEPEKQLLDKDGHVLLGGITHYNLRGLYNRLWNESISKTKWHDTLNMLKLAGFFESESCYLDNTDKAADVRRMEMLENGADAEEVEKALPSVYSMPSYKWLTHSFIAALGLSEKSDIVQSKERAIQKRVANKLSTFFATYKPFSNGFWTKKRNEFRRRLGMLRYPQGATQDSSAEYFSHELPELIPLRH